MTGRLSATVRVAAPLKLVIRHASCIQPARLSATVRVAAPLKPKREFWTDLDLLTVRDRQGRGPIEAFKSFRRHPLRLPPCPRPSGSRPH